MRSETARKVLGLTLVEALCVLAIAGLIMVAVLGALEATVSGIRRGRAALRDARLAHGIAALLSADFAEAASIRTADTPAFIGGGGTGPGGGPMLAFFTRHSAFPMSRPSGSGVFRVEYILEENEERAGVFSLFRRESPYLPGREEVPGGEGEAERVAEGLTAVRLRFFDGTQWYDSWQRMALPHMMRVQYGMAGEGAEPRWETECFLAPVASADVDVTPQVGGDSSASIGNSNASF